MRRVPVLLAAVALAVATVSPASAHPVDRFDDDHLSVGCDVIGVEQGSASFYADISTEYGSFAGLVFWAPPAMPDGAPPTLLSGESTLDLTSDGTQVSAVLAMYEYSEDPATEPVYAGDATVQVTLEPIGDPEPFSYGSEGSNQHYTVSGTVQNFAVSGIAQLPGDVTFELANCYGYHEMVSVFATNPDAYVFRSSGISLSCFWEMDGSVAFLNAQTDNGYSFAELYLADESGEAYGGTDQITLDSSAFAASFDLFSIISEPEPGSASPVVQATGPGEGEPAGSVDAQATFVATRERTRITDRFGFAKSKYSATRLSVDGTAEVTLGDASFSLPMDDASCYAEAYRYQDRYASPNEHAKGPGGGKPLANDLPQNATPIAVGSAISVRSTGGTDPVPEVPCTQLNGDGFEEEVPIGHTAWWTFEGTGGDVTVDTAGSNFDTVVGVYTLDEGGYAEVGCVDDVFIEPDGGSLQAAITIAADGGVTYYVQVGGFGGLTGSLELAVY